MRFKVYHIILAGSILVAGCKTKSGMNNGWVSLLDNNSTKGWHGYGNAAISPAWKVENGILHLDPKADKGSSDFVTDNEYSDFHLKLDWKISQKGNSGIIFYVKEDPAKYPKTYNTGMEMQVLDNEGHTDGKIIKHRAGDLYDLISSTTEPVKAVGEWNTAEIKSKDNKLELYLNGVKVVTTQLWDDNWRSMIAKSKFKVMPGFGIFKSGRIALQNHGDEVWYRNIMIKKL